ncbi:hypothetical protein LCGC14_2721710, partial [marine sediment metagenome]
DNTDGDALKITDDVNPSTGNTVWEMTTAGERTMPLQPAFLATHSAAQNDVTGNNTAVTVDFTTTIFDQNADYDGTNTYTSPVTGRHQFNTSVRFDDLAANSTNGVIRIVTSNRSYQSSAGNYGALRQTTADVNAITLSHATITDMDAADTAFIQVLVGGMGADTVDLIGDVTSTYFSGGLLF